jgi:hypothetical protein
MLKGDPEVRVHPYATDCHAREAPLVSLLAGLNVHRVEMRRYFPFQIVIWTI